MSFANDTHEHVLKDTQREIGMKKEAGPHYKARVIGAISNTRKASLQHRKDPKTEQRQH